MAATPILLAIFLALVLTLSASAKDDVYMKPSVFVANSFKGKPEAGALTLTKGMQSEIKRFMGRAYTPARVRYWTDGNRTAWILNEIGKTQPITTGYVVANGKIEQVQVLIYRESHGWEVRQPFFTKQFLGAELNERSDLSKRVDNVSGATLSVNALTKMAKLALYLEAQRVGSS